MHEVDGFPSRDSSRRLLRLLSFQETVVVALYVRLSSVYSLICEKNIGYLQVVDGFPLTK